jgi:hypothetical protein
MIFHHIKKLWPYMFTALFIVFVVETLTGFKELEVLEGILALLCLVISLPAARTMFKVISLIFLAAGIAFAVWGQITLSVFFEYMGSNVTLFSLLFVLPFINRTIVIGGYARHLSRWLNVQADHLGKLHVRATVVSYVLSLFLFLASIPLVHSVLNKHLQGQETDIRNRFMSTSILRGYGAVAVWSPVEPLVAMAVILTGASYVALLPFLLLVSLLIVVIAGIWGTLQFRSIPLDASVQNSEGKRPAPVKFLSLFAGLTLLIASAYLLQTLLSITFFEAMTLLVMPFAAVWALVLGRFKRFASATRLQWKPGLADLPNLNVLFLSFGLFNKTITETPLLSILSEPVQAIAEWPVLLYLVVMAAGTIFPVVGIHPFVTMGLFGVVLQPVLGQLNPVSVAVVLISSCVTSSVIGAFSTTLSMTSGLLNINPYRITWWNCGFAAVFGLSGVAVGLLLL